MREGKIGYFGHSSGREREGYVFINPSRRINKGRTDFQKVVCEGSEKA